MRFKNLEGNLEMKSLKRTISPSSGLLQMVSETDTEWCASKDAGTRMG